MKKIVSAHSDSILKINSGNFHFINRPSLFLISNNEEMRKPKNNKFRKREFINHAIKKRKLRVERVGPRIRAEWGYKVKCVS